MKKLLLLTLFLSGHFCILAQNWRTVSSDTAFFSVLVSPGSYGIDSNRLRTMWIDSAGLTAQGDSIFHFFRAIRVDTPVANCQDTAAPSWLGPHMIRKADGREYYFGRRGDTITFRTLASLGEQWIIAKDITGTEFQGTVTSLISTSIDGVVDSLKTISIQAFKSGVPVSDPFNTLVFQLSKAHGWIKTLDLFRFTDNRSTAIPYGMLMLSGQHQRIPSAFATSNAGLVDLAWRYAAGNDFITFREYGVPNQTGNGHAPAPIVGGNTVTTHDSVLAFVLLAPDKAAVTLHTNSYSHLWKQTFTGTGFADTTFTSSYTHMDTILSEAGKEVRKFPLYESVAGPISNARPSGFEWRYLFDTLSDGRFSLEEQLARPSYWLIQSGGCWILSINISGVEVNYLNWVEEFGARMTFWYVADFMPILFDRTEVKYAHLPGLTWGTKVDVLKLGIGSETASTVNLFTVYPNPASSQITVSSSKYQRTVQLILRNVLGQKMRELKFSGQTILPVNDLTSGMYFLEVENGEIRQEFKVMIQH